MSRKDYEQEKQISGSLEFTEELFEIAEKQRKKSICKIKTSKGGHGTGFLCKFPFGNNENLLPVLITNNHIINEVDIYNTGEIIFYREIDYNLPYNISFDIPRMFYTNKEYDFTIIEIKYEDNLDLNSFLEVDYFYLDLDYAEEAIKDLEVYALHFPTENKAILTTGTIESLNNNSIYHKCSTDKGSSGCPIITAINSKVIGIHKGSFNNKNLNTGTFIKYAIVKLFVKLNK